jgi:epidermal growth factor receptor substrate 15
LRNKCSRFIVAPSKGLLDDDDDPGIGASSTTINDHSAEIGNLQNQLQSTMRSLENTTTERSNVEATVQNQAARLSALQTQLSSAKAAYETESRLLATLRERFSDQSSEIQKATEELIRAESDLSAVRVEKAEVEQGLLRDKEEVRELQRKMTETGSTIEVTKAETEKARKEAKQQKGLLAIAKKQLAAREAERAKVAQELQEATAEAGEVTREREIAEAELAREPTMANTANGHSFVPSPTLSADSVTSAAQPLPGTPGSPSSVSGSTAAKSNNPFERLAAGPGSQSPFVPFANASVPTPSAVTSTRNEGTTTDNPFTFEQAFGGEEARPGPDVQEPSTAPEGNGQPFTTKVESELRVGANEEVSEPSSDHDLFMTPPTSALDGLGASANTLTAEPAVQNLLPLGIPSAAPSTDRPSDAHTDINTRLKELDVNESDSSDDDSDETPLAHFVGRAPPGSNRDEAVKEAPVSNGDASPQTTVETTFPPLTGTVAAAEVQSANPFPPPAKDSSPFSTLTSPFAAALAETPKAATVSDFDKAFGDLPATVPTPAGNNLSFDNAFDDQFDFAKADAAASLPTEGTASASSTTFPPPPTSTSGTMKPLTTIARDTGFENAFSPQQSTAGPARPVDGLPVLPPVPESKPFSFESAFGAGVSAVPPPGVTTQLAPNQPPFIAPVASPLLDDAFGIDSTQQGSAFGTASSRSSSIPQVTQSPVSARASSSPVRGTISPREIVNFPVSPPPGPPPTSPPLPPRVASPRGRPSTSSSKESGKEPVRHSKLSVSDMVHSCPGVENMTLVPVLDPSTV